MIRTTAAVVFTPEPVPVDSDVDTYHALMQAARAELDEARGEGAT